MRLPPRGKSASQPTLDNCDRVLHLLKRRGPMMFAELRASINCSNGQLTFYMRRLYERGLAVHIEKHGTAVKWGLPEHVQRAIPSFTGSKDNFKVAGRIEIGRGSKWGAGLV